MSDELREEFLDGHPNVLVVTIDRPPVNALTLELYVALDDLFQGLETRRDVHCVVLTGAGRKAFVAGADAKALVGQSPRTALERAPISKRAFDAVRRSPVPVICAVNASAVGGGFMLAAGCDFIVASKEAKFGLPELAVGIPVGTRHLEHIIPERIARYIAFTGRKISAQEVERFGGIQAVVEPENVLPTALAIADEIAQKDPLIVRLSKDALYLTEHLPFEEGYRTQQLYTTIAAALREREMPEKTRENGDGSESR